MTENKFNKNPTSIPLLNGMLGRYILKKGTVEKFYDLVVVNPKIQQEAKKLSRPILTSKTEEGLIFEIRWGKTNAKKIQTRRVSYFEIFQESRKLQQKGYQLIEDSPKTLPEIYEIMIKEAVSESLDNKIENENIKPKNRSLI